MWRDATDRGARAQLYFMRLKYWPNWVLNFVRYKNALSYNYLLYYTMDPSSMELNILTLSTGYYEHVTTILPQPFEIAECNFIRLCIAVKEK